MAFPEWTRKRGYLQPWGAGVGPPPGWYGPVIPPQRLPPVLSRTYEGTANTIRQLREVDAEALAARGYYPTSEVWIAQRRGWVTWLIAVLLILVLVGLLIVIYYFANPTGVLTVTYTRRVETPGTAAARQPAPASASADDVQSSLKALGQLREAGVITDAEYDTKRRDVLDRL